MYQAGYNSYPSKHILILASKTQENGKVLQLQNKTIAYHSITALRMFDFI